jgi:hypothetical protein
MVQFRDRGRRRFERTQGQSAELFTDNLRWISYIQIHLGSSVKKEQKSNRATKYLCNVSLQQPINTLWLYPRNPLKFCQPFQCRWN